MTQAGERPPMKTEFVRLVIADDAQARRLNPMDRLAARTEGQNRFDEWLRSIREEAWAAGYLAEDHLTLEDNPHRSKNDRP